MLIPITRERFETLLPLTATASQYAYYWGNWQNVVKQVLFSLLGIFIVWLLSFVLHSQGLSLFLGIVFGLYWLWSPVAKASLRNAKYRRYPYSGFWQGEILDVYVTEEVIGTEETANAKGELVLVENRERRLNLELGDERGFFAQVQVPLRRQHQFISPGQTAHLLVMSEDRDLHRIAKLSDLYIPSRQIWVSDYPWLQREAFKDVSQQLGRGNRRRTPPPSRRP
ncbi:MAG: phosphate ABC transporter permease [Phormidium sp. GEM2.Bin31]|nr:MAG: phosphate ABC transporter permease [Phormidium sp. GEM2.Bin31]